MLGETALETVIARMKLEPNAPLQETLAGLVERVTFHNEENGFCVLRTKARGHRDLVTVIGQAASISAGERITVSGEWVNDRAHGQQFRARFLKTSVPTPTEGIEKYLGSEMIRASGRPVQDRAGPSEPHPPYAETLPITSAGRFSPLGPVGIRFTSDVIPARPRDAQSYLRKKGKP
jgi:hypothetical protein